MQALRRHSPARSPDGCGPRPHPRLQGPTPTHLAIYHHPQPRQLIASPRARPGARRGRSPRPARGAAGRPAAGLMARPPVPARPGAPRPSPMPLPLSAPRLASPRFAALLAVGASLLGSAGAPGARDGWVETARPRPGPAQLAHRCEGRAPGARAPGQARPPFPPGAGDWTWDDGLVSTARRAHVTPPSRAHAPRTESFCGLVSCVSQPSRLRCTSTLVGFRITVTGAKSGWTWRSWTLLPRYLDATCRTQLGGSRL